MPSKNPQLDPRKEVLYKFWDELPEQKIIVDYDDKFFSHFARKFVFGLLGKGIEETLPDGTAVVRRALNAQEILQELQRLIKYKFKDNPEKQEKFELSIHSLYFHLQKLEELGFIKTVTILKEGRHNVAYYGRSAKVVIMKETYQEDENLKNVFSTISALFLHLNPNLDETKFEEFYARYVTINKEELDSIQRKIGKYETAISETQIDPNNLQTFFLLLNNVNPKYRRLFKEIIDYLDLELW